jgi:CPA2 family monovalent cation:H+ antiporter-2
MHLPSLIHDLAIILGVAAIVTFVFQRIKQPVVLGYILAGFIVGPHTPGWLSISDVPNITTWAELGVIFLMFSLGLEFSFRRLAKVGGSAGFTAIVQTITMSLLGYGAGQWLGWTTIESLFLGCMISISSTTIIIKALDELGLKKKKFAENVFGILIVEDLVAILMLVALTNIAMTSEVGGLDLLMAAGKLAVVVGAWFVLGMFAVPHFVRSVSKHGTNETLIIVSLGLCLTLVTISAKFEYSVALGAFIMGAILAESRDVHRIEGLLEPLRDVFGAVFFVSVGMLLDPQVILNNMTEVALITVVIITGKVISVTIASLLSGQNTSNSVHAGLSLGQIGEFSFIIATLGLNYKVIDPKLYPIIVAASLITTFTTPYMIRVAPAATSFLEKILPDRWLKNLHRYEFWIKSRLLSKKSQGNGSMKKIMKWLANAVVVITVFALVRNFAVEPLSTILHDRSLAHILVWGIGFLFSTPFIWGMSTIFRPQAGTAVDGPAGGMLFLSQILTLMLVGFLSSEFLSFRVAVGLTFAVGLILFMLFWRKIDSYYQWFEERFASGFEDAIVDPLNRYAPWDMFLVELAIDSESRLVGQTLLESQLREKYGINVVVMKRGRKAIVAPRANEQIFPGDVLLCTATEDEIQRMLNDQKTVRTDGHEGEGRDDLESYQMHQVHVNKDARAVGKSIRSAGLNLHFSSMVVGLERDKKRIANPNSDTDFEAGDRVWLVGPDSKKKGLTEFFQGAVD